ncbi:MAG: tetratricopeptide repeat protein [Flavobacteriales bacterium]|nr:tetratricopeptide repeat protein [Flavobacteriales bacterium]
MLFVPLWSFGQKDSLFLVWKNPKVADSLRVKAYSEYLHKTYLFSEPDSAIYFAEEAIRFCEKRRLPNEKANAINIIGIANAVKGDISKAIEEFEKALAIYEQTKNNKGIASELNNIALVYSDLGKPEKALQYFDRGLELYRKTDNQKGIASTLTNIGIVYHNQGNYSKAIENYTAGLVVSERLKDRSNMAVSNTNIGIVYYEQREYEKAKEYFKKGIDLNTELGNLQGLGLIYNYYGSIYSDLGNYKEALKYYRIDLDYHEKLGDKQGIAIALNNMGNIFRFQGNLDTAEICYRNSLALSEETGNSISIPGAKNNLGIVAAQRGDYKKSIQYSRSALQLAQEFELNLEVRDASQALWSSYKKIGDYKQALEMFELYIATRDTIESEENKKAIIEQKFKYEYDKQHAADSVRNVEEQKVKDAEIVAQKAELKASRTQELFLYGGLALVVAFALFIVNRLRVSRLQNKIIEEQKKMVEVKNKEITDSITYAKRIQSAILPPLETINEAFPDSFVLYKPKDIVAGDFYWFEPKINNAMIAACDCTGHGVPGAMVSVVCNNALNRSVREFGFTDPAEILNRTREIVIEEFSKSSEEVKDGMDISLLVIEEKQNDRVIARWAGANNPLWIIRNAASEVEEIKADKQPIGKYHVDKPFQSHRIELNRGDMIFLFSDGFQDQFGGDKSKKLKASSFREMLLKNRNESMNQLAENLNREFERWKGDLEQNDDVCVIGIRF